MFRKMLYFNRFQLKSLFVLMLVFACFSKIQAQLSLGKGETITVGSGKYKMYLPQYFRVQEQPPGVIHNASGTFICIVEVPEGQLETLSDQKSEVKKVLVDDRMTNVVFQDTQALSQLPDDADNTYLMTYDLQGFTFERINTFREHEGKKYLILANYHTRIKSKVYEEVIQIIKSIEFL